MPQESQQIVFNTGVLTLVPPGSNPTPIQVGTLKDISLDISYSVVELRGMNMFADDIALKDGKITGKAKSGRLYGAILQAIMQGMTSAAGQRAVIYDERGTVPTTPYQITVAQGATFAEDLGVVDINTGLPLTRVASAPATGQYSVNASGQYTFAAADTTHVMSFRYAYTIAATGSTFSLLNTVMGGSTAVKYALHLYNNYQGAASGFKLPAVIFPKLGLGWKAGEYLELDIDFQAFPDSTGKVIDFFKA